MLTRRRILGYSALAPAALAYGPVSAQTPSASTPLRLAIIGTTYHVGSELQTIADRFLLGYPHEGEWRTPNVRVVSMYVEHRPRGGRGEGGRGRGQATPPPPETGPLADLSAARAKEFNFRVFPSIAEALRCGRNSLGVDAVLSVVEQRDYPRNHAGQILYPRYDFFQQCAQIFEEEGRSVPYFNNQNLSYSFRQAQSMVTTAERLKFPLLSGSALTVTWRLPDIDIPIGASIQEAVMVCPFEGMEFDAIEALQCMMERRKGGETGVKNVQLLEGDEVWAASDSGRWSKEVLSSALSRSDGPLGITVIDGRPQDMAMSGVLPQLVKNPAAYSIEYTDGTRATMLVLQGADNQFTFSARVPGHGFIATQFFRSPAPNLAYSAALTAKVEEMFVTKNAPYPVRRNLLTAGILDAAYSSRNRMNQRIDTPHLAIRYQPPSQPQYARL